MKRVLEKGETCYYDIIVNKEDVASFHGKIVHNIYSTFALARDAEFSTRQFILMIADADEEGIGISLSIEHIDSAFVGEKIRFQAEVVQFDNKKLICKWVARAGERMIARGETGQKLLKKEAIVRLLERK